MAHGCAKARASLPTLPEMFLDSVTISVKFAGSLPQLLVLEVLFLVGVDCNYVVEHFMRSGDVQASTFLEQSWYHYWG